MSENENILEVPSLIAEKKQREMTLNINLQIEQFGEVFDAYIVSDKGKQKIASVIKNLKKTNEI